VRQLSQVVINHAFTLIPDPADMRALACLILLCACDTPSPDFWGVEATRVMVQGTTFDVRIKDRKAEAIRLNAEPRPRWMVIGAKAGLAIERVSGCKIKKLGGDPAVVLAKLKCKNDPDQQRYLPRNLTYDCDIDDTYFSRGRGVEVTEMNCELVEL
jgi:hypothetical protein